jgi:hypothetical protein
MLNIGVDNAQPRTGRDARVFICRDAKCNVRYKTNASAVTNVTQIAAREDCAADIVRMRTVLNSAGNKNFAV